MQLYNLPDIRESSFPCGEITEIIRWSVSGTFLSRIFSRNSILLSPSSDGIATR
jgi:hypothetical protein